MRARDPSYRLERLRALARQVQGMGAPIVGSVPSLDQTAFLELIDEDYEAARHHAENRAQRLLADACVLLDDAQGSRVRWRQIEGGQPPGEPGGRMGTDLREQERGRARVANVTLHGRIMP